jgi:hypothetical protein
MAKHGSPEVDKRDPRVAEIFTWVEAQYQTGRITAMAPEELMDQMVLHFPNMAFRS